MKRIYEIHRVRWDYPAIAEPKKEDLFNTIRRDAKKNSYLRVLCVIVVMMLGAIQFIWSVILIT